MAEKRVAIHQPQYLPWVPYFDKILRSDVFVLLDNVQFQKNGLQNRNKIKTANGDIWLTVPVVHSFGQNINETRIADGKALDKHAKTVEMNYRKAPYFDDVYGILKSSMDEGHEVLADLNNSIIKRMLDYLDYEGEIILASTLDAQGKGSDLVLNICKQLDAAIYFSGSGGREYINLGDFDAAGIEVVFQEYRNVEYTQLYPKVGFVADLSIVDLLFNCGKDSLSVIEEGRDI